MLSQTPRNSSAHCCPNMQEVDAWKWRKCGNSLHSALCPAFPAAITTMPANVPLPLPTDQLNCRFQQQQTTQMHSPSVPALSFSSLHSLITIPFHPLFQLQSQTNQLSHKQHLHCTSFHSTRQQKSTKPLRADVHNQLRFRNFIQWLYYIGPQLPNSIQIPI